MTAEQLNFVTDLESVSLALSGWAERRFKDGWSVADVRAVLGAAMEVAEKYR